MPYASPPNAPPEYKKGWEQGCKTGFSAYGNAFMKTMYSFEQDVNMMRNQTYVKAWSDSFDYCRSLVNRLQSGGGRKLAAGDNAGIFSTTGLNVRPTYDLRDGSSISDGLGLFNGGIELPGWGKDETSFLMLSKIDYLGSNESTKDHPFLELDIDTR